MSTAHSIIKNFYNRGFKLLGYGCYSAVFQLNDSKVVKIGADIYDPYIYFLEAVRGVANKHFPKVSYFHIDYQHEYYIVVLEKLNPLLLDTENEETYASVVKHKTPVDSELQDAYNLIVDMVENHNNAKDFKLDLHTANVMVREENVLVFTDPLCDEHMYDNPEIELWIEEMFDKKVLA